MGDKRKMSKVEQLAQEQFNTFRNRFCEIISEVAEEHRSAFMQGYAKGETDEKFRTKQVVTSHIADLEKENTELKELVEKYRQAVDKCLHITFMGAGCEVNTVSQYATLVDGYLTDVEGLAKWKD